MTPEDGFESAQLLAAWADTQLGELKAAITAFYDTNPCAVVEEVNTKTNRLEIKLRVQPVPYRIRGLTTNIVKNLRDALDQATNAASLSVNGRARRNTHFPFGTSPADFDTSIATSRQCADIPAALWPILKGYQPYPTGNDWAGGNDYLKLLGVISGPNKHRFTLETIPIASDIEIPITSINFGAGGAINSGRDRKGDYVLAEIGRGGHANLDQIKVVLRVAFADTKLKGIQVWPYLRSCCNTVSHIVHDLQTQVFDLSRKG